MTQPAPETARGVQVLVGAKLDRPELPPNQIVRSQLFERLERIETARITLISAPAGYGKTTLVSQWLESDSSTPVAWLSLDRADNDLERFVRYVIAALRRVEEYCLPKTEQMLSAPTLPPPRVLAESMVAEIEMLGQRTVLVLDDYGLIRSQDVHELMGSLIPWLPTTLRLVVASRIDPPLPLSLWRSRHWLHELRAADLRFSLEETRSFFATASNVELSDEGIDTIHRKTEGWITGLRLALLALIGEADVEERVLALSASDRLIADYLVEEVLARQPTEIREFLAVTSVLERFNAQLCDELLAVTGSESAGRSRDLLDRLFRKNLFLVPLGPGNDWYRYHQLFQELLVDRFDELDSAVPREEILKRAGDWFCEEGWIEDGLKCYLEAGDLNAAEDVIGTHLHDVITNELSRRTLARWLDMFPPGAERGRLPLLVALSYVRSLRTDHEGMEELLEVIEATCGGVESERQREWWNKLEPDLDYLRAAVCFWKGDVEGTYVHGSRVFERLSDPRGVVVAFTTMFYGDSLALTGRWAEYRCFIESGTDGRNAADRLDQLPYLSVKADVHLFTGELAELRTVASNMTTSTAVAIPKYYEAIGDLFLGFVAYERNQIDEAERYFQAVEARRFDTTAWTYHAAVGGLALVALARGNLDAAQEHVISSRAFAIQSRSPILNRDSEAVERYVAVAAGKPVDLATPPPPDPDFTHASILPPSYSWALAQLQSPSRETRQAALDFIDVTLQRAASHGVNRRVIPLSALRALALDALNRRDEAIPVLEDALRRGAGLGFVRSFVDCGEGIRPLLRAISEENPDDEYVAMLLDAFASPASSSKGTDQARFRSTAGRGGGALFEDLTNRELDVLELLQQRLTNKEVAAGLAISPGTVKMHTRSIYRKLGVRGRRQAVAAAVELGILRS